MPFHESKKNSYHPRHFRELEIMEKSAREEEKEEKDDYSDLKGKAFMHGADTPRGRQERNDYRKGKRVGIGGKVTYE